MGRVTSVTRPIATDMLFSFTSLLFYATANYRRGCYAPVGLTMESLTTRGWPVGRR